MLKLTVLYLLLLDQGQYHGNAIALNDEPNNLAPFKVPKFVKKNIKEAELDKKNQPIKKEDHTKETKLTSNDTKKKI